jgi:hypothetical protein
MRYGTPRKRLISPRRARLLAAAALVSGVLVAGCGGSSGNPTVANVASSTTSTGAASAGAATTSTSSTATTARSDSATANGAPSSGPPSQAALEAQELAFARCMRSNGVPDFPDPSAGGGFRVAVPADGRSPALFKAAQARCQKLLPGGPGSGPAPSPQTVAHWVAVAQCMRRHGISNFPDPRTTVPSHPIAGGGAGVISDRDGVILVFPHTIDEQSPLFTRAAAACGFQLTNH